MAKHVQTKALLGILNGDDLHVVVTSPGATTEYDDNRYTVVEGDTVEDLVAGKNTPIEEVIEQAMPDASKTMVKNERIRLAAVRVAKAVKLPEKRDG